MPLPSLIKSIHAWGAIGSARIHYYHDHRDDMDFLPIILPQISDLEHNENIFSGHLRIWGATNLATPKATLWISSSGIPMFEANRCVHKGFMLCRSALPTEFLSEAD